MPPLFIQVGTAEILLDDARRLAAHAEAAGVSVTLDEWPEMIHGWQGFAAFLPEAFEALERVGEFLTDRVRARDRDRDTSVLVSYLSFSTLYL